MFGGGPLLSQPAVASEVWPDDGKMALPTKVMCKSVERHSEREERARVPKIPASWAYGVCSP